MIYRFVLRSGFAFEVDKPSATATPATITARKAIVLQISDPPGIPDQIIDTNPFLTFDRVRLIPPASPIRAVYYEQESP